MRFESVTMTALTAVAARQGEPLSTRSRARRSIHATAPVCSKPRITTNSEAKKSSRSQSTRSMAYAGSRCAISTMSAPAAMATSGNDPPANHPTTATANMASPRVTSGRSSATGTASSRSRNGSRSSRRYTHRR